MSSGKKILFQLSGSIACYKSCSVISRLVQSGHDVQTVATASALKFIGNATLEGLTGRTVFSDIFESGKLMGHIDWAKWADLTIVCPATANTISALANGIAVDAIGTLFLAYDLKKPYLVAPAMNQQMWQHPATQRSLEVLKSYGVTVLPTTSGHQACGDVGPGRLLEPEAIYDHVTQALSAPGVSR
jgi:phosphopantothenoylcysteine synthetase/decarboxylase